MHKVLVIDSSLTSAESLTSALSKSGFEVVLASSELEGFRVGDEIYPDAIVVRDSPPKLNGVRFCRALRNLFNLPLILLSRQREKEVYSQNAEGKLEWDYYMHLPVNDDELVARLRVLLWRYGKGKRPGEKVGQ